MASAAHATFKLPLSNRFDGLSDTESDSGPDSPELPTCEKTEQIAPDAIENAVPSKIKFTNAALRKMGKSVTGRPKSEAVKIINGLGLARKTHQSGAQTQRRAISNQRPPKVVWVDGKAMKWVPKK